MATQLVDKVLNEEQKHEKMRIEYAKEFFVTAEGEIIRMAAIVAQMPHIKKSLDKQEKQTAERRSIQSDEQRSRRNRRRDGKPITEIDIFVSVFELKNSHEVDPDQLAEGQ